MNALTHGALNGDGGEDGADCRWNGSEAWQSAVGVSRGRSGDELRVEVALDAASPGADETEIQAAADGGAGEGDEASDPFFRGFGAEADGEALDDHGRDFFDETFFGEVFAEINSRGSSGGEPEFALLFIVAKIKTVEKAEPLDQAECDDCEQAGVGNERDHSAEAKAGAFQECKALGVAKQSGGDGV